MLKPSATLRTQQSTIFITGADKYGELPKGFFRCLAASGKETLGYNGTFVCFDCGETVVDGQRITLTVPRAELPQVKLNFRKATTGVQQVGASSIIDTDTLEPNGDVVWVGPRPRSSVEYV